MQECIAQVLVLDRTLPCDTEHFGTSTTKPLKIKKDNWSNIIKFETMENKP